MCLLLCVPSSPPTSPSRWSTQNACFTSKSAHGALLLRSLQKFPTAEIKPMSSSWPAKVPDDQSIPTSSPTALTQTHSLSASPNFLSLCLCPPSSWDDPAKESKDLFLQLLQGHSEASLATYRNGASPIVLQPSLAPPVGFCFLHSTYLYLTVIFMFIYYVFSLQPSLKLQLYHGRNSWLRSLCMTFSRHSIKVIECMNKWINIVYAQYYWMMQSILFSCKRR